MKHESEYETIESKTWEIVKTEKDNGGYIVRRVVYRIWSVGDGDWKIQTIDTEEPEPQTVFLPSKVVELIKRESVKKDLKNER